MIEEFFGGVVGADITPKTITTLPKRQWQVLSDRLNEVRFTGILDNERAEKWATAANIPSTCRIPVSECWENYQAAAPLTLYCDNVLCEDPIVFCNAQNTVARELLHLAELRPLIHNGALIIYPGKLGWDLFTFPIKRNLSQRDWDSANELSRLLPHYPADDVAHFMTLNLLVAGWVGADPVAVASRPALLDGVLQACGARVIRANKLGAVALPSFHRLGSVGIAKLREDSAALSEVRRALDAIADELPRIGEELSPTRASEIIADLAGPAASSLHREIRNTPSLEAYVGFALTLGAGLVDAFAGTLSPGGATTLAASPVPLLVSLFNSYRKGRGKRLASRALLELSAPDEDLVLLLEEARRVSSRY